MECVSWEHASEKLNVALQGTPINDTLLSSNALLLSDLVLAAEKSCIYVLEYEIEYDKMWHTRSHVMCYNVAS